MTAPKRWPYQVKHLRDSAAEELATADRALGALLNGGQLTESERIRLTARVALNIKQALRCLEAAGAQTNLSE